MATIHRDLNSSFNFLTSLLAPLNTINGFFFLPSAVAVRGHHRGHHVYKKIWKPLIGETLVCLHDTRAEAKQYDDFAVGVYLVDDQDDGQKLVGHVTIELSFLLCKFLTRDSCILKFSPAGARMLEDSSYTL